MRQSFLNSYVDPLSMDQTVAKIETIIAKGIPTQHVVLNAHKINLMYRDEQLKEIVNSCPLINADGISIVLGAQLLGLPKIERVTGVDLFYRLLSEAAVKNYRIFMLGATEEVVTKVVSKAQQAYPAIQIVGYRNGYFSEEESPEIAKTIGQSKADIVFVAFSSPQKEYWIHENLPEMAAAIAIGVGGSFDVYAGKSQRAPQWIQRIGLEWLYRFGQEPVRMFRRYVFGNVEFLGHLFREKHKQTQQKIKAIRK